METRAERLLSASNRAATEPGLLAERGGLLLKLGRFDEAEKALREALGRDPRLAGAWLRLAQVRRWREASRSPAEAMREALARPGLDDSTRAAIGFALAKVADDLGEYRQAWDAAVEANQLRARSAHFDRPGWERYEATLPRVFTPDFYATGRQGGGDSPVFIVGMPRSGTTLLERRLGRHSRLVPAGELEVVERVGIELAGPAGYPDGLSSVTPEIFEAVAREWRQRLPAALPAGGDVIDKNPLNFLHLGLIVRLFPHARIVHCRRGALDTLLSLWFQNFAHPRNDYAYRPDDLAWMYAFYRRVMSFWESTLPVRIHAVDYERLVENPEGELRALAAALALPWEPAMARAGADGAISTASLWQARQPVYRRSAGRWRNYERWIGPLRDALARAGIAETA